MGQFSRREMMAGAAAGLAIPGIAYAADPVIPEATIAARKNAPVIKKAVNKIGRAHV